MPSSSWPWVFRELKPHASHLAILLLLSLAEVGLRMLLPWPLKAVLDHVISKLPLAPTTRTLLAPLVAIFGAVTSREAIASLGGIVVAGLIIQVAHQVVLMFHSRRQGLLGVELVRSLRERLFEHLQALALGHHERQPTGAAVHRLEADAGCIEQLALRGLFPLVFSGITLAAMFAVLLSIDWRLALASLGIVPPLFWWMRSRTPRIAVRAQAARVAEAEMVSHLYESFAAIRLVKSFAREAHERARFARAAGAVRTAQLVTLRQDATFAIGVGVLTTIGTALVLGLGGLFVVQGAVTSGTLLVALTYLGFVYGPLSGIANTAGTVQHALAGAERVREALRLPREDLDEPGAVDPPLFRGVVEYDHVSFAYGAGGFALRDVTFRVEPNQLVAVVGPSGSGKTTLVSLLPRLRALTGGAVRIDGVDLRRYRLDGIRRQIAIVLQDAVVVSGTVADNLRYGRLDATDDEIEAAARLAHAHEFITGLPRGYRTRLAEGGRSLSGGQKQRISIARAFLKNAPIVILDEPTSALDTISERQVVDALQHLRAGRATFVIAHRLSTVRGADVILLLDRGRLAAQGTHDELAASSPLYREMATAMIE